MTKKNKFREKQLQLIQQKSLEVNNMNTPTTTVKPMNILAWAATPYVITGFGCVMKELLQNLYKSYPGMYNIHLVGINFHGEYQNELEITGGLQNGRLTQTPAAAQLAGGAMNLYGQTKLLEVLRNTTSDLDAVFLFEDPFWIGGNVPGANANISFIDAVKSELHAKGMSHVPVICYFPIDGIPKKSWIENIAKYDIPITYLKFGANACIQNVPKLNGRISIIPHGVNPSEFFPISKHESMIFKRAMFGERSANKFMLLNVNRNQMRKLVPSTLMAFKVFQQQVPESFIYLNMKPVDVGWNLLSVCDSLGLEVGKDVMFPPDFSVQKGLSIEDLNKVFNCADALVSTATGGGWELAITQAFATKTLTIMPGNTSHVELCGPQGDPLAQRGILYNSGTSLALQTVFTSDNEVVRPMPDLDDMVNKLLWAYSHKEETERIKENAYNWVTSELTWEKHVVPKFHKIFQLAKNVKQDRVKQLTNNQG